MGKTTISVSYTHLDTPPKLVLRMEERLEIFSSNDIPLDGFGTGIDVEKKTKSNLFIIIPDDDDTFNFVPGMVYTLLFQELYHQARFFGGKLPMDVGFWLDEMAKKIYSTPNDKKRHEEM